MPAAPERSTWPDRVVRALLVLAVGGVAYASLAPTDDLPAPLLGSDKLTHALGYLAIGVLAVASAVPAWAAFAGAVAFGLLLEVLQGWLGYRSFEWGDVLADALGALAGILLARPWVGQWRRWLDSRAHERKRAWRRARRDSERVPSDRHRNEVRAAARTEAPAWEAAS